MSPILRAFFALALPLAAQADEPIFRPNDVIALVGGEDLVAASEEGFLEGMLTLAKAGLHLRFRNLAWEGDTVYEQRRDLNFPPLESQLERIRASVVITQFGQMECLADKGGAAEFKEAYLALLKRLGGEGKRRLLVLAPCAFNQSASGLSSGSSRSPRTQLLAAKADRLREFTGACQAAAEEARAAFLNTADLGVSDAPLQRDGIHLNTAGHRYLATQVLLHLHLPVNTYQGNDQASDHLWQLIRTKNRLWANYWRPQNWAFLAGDRTTQPSSRDHLDPSKRWFPAEMEQFLPLIESKEGEIDAAVTELVKARSAQEPQL